jgi:predicted N-acetyltransferase YhbS
MTGPALRLDEISGVSNNALLSALLDEAFEVSPGAHYFEDFPVWDERIAPAGPKLTRVGVFRGDALVASACARIAELKTPQGTRSVALIGAVATRKDHRGQGLASQAVEFILKWVETRGATAAFLWGSEHSLYGRLGFELAGEQLQLPLSAMDSSKVAEHVRSGWTPGIFELLRRREGGLLLGPADLQWLSAHRHVDWFWTGDERAPDAYAAIGRGIDLTGMVHEWGGAPEKLKALLIYLKARFPEASLLGHPRILRMSGLLPARPPAPQGLALTRILDSRKFASELLREVWIWGLDAV